MLRKFKLSRAGKPGFEEKVEIAPSIVESAYVRGEYEPVVKNIRESSISWLHSHGQIDDAQRMAGEWFRGTYERTRMGTMAVDPSHEPVDTSGKADPIPDRAIAAIEELTAVRRELGRTPYCVVELICGQGWSIKEVAFMTARPRIGIGEILRMALDDLAEMRGYATRSGK
jgi:hypothetical protein